MISASHIFQRPGLSPIPALKPLQFQIDSLVGGFVSQATDWRSLAGFTAGGLASRTARIGAMGFGSGNLIRIASVGLGLTAEVSTFELTNRTLISSKSEISNLWRWSGSGGIRQGLLQSFVTFGTLKGAGRLVQGENFLVQHLVQDSAMVAGHHLSGALGFAGRPRGTLAEQILNAEATTLQIGAGMALSHRFAPGIGALEGGLDLMTPSPLSLSLEGEGGRRSGEGGLTRRFHPVPAAEGLGSGMMASIIKGPRGAKDPSGLNVSGGVRTDQKGNEEAEVPPAVRLVEWMRNGLPESEIEGTIPKEELDRLPQLPLAYLVPRDPKAQVLLVSQMRMGPLRTLRERLELLTLVLSDPHQMGKSYYGSVTNAYGPVMNNLHYLREELPRSTIASLIGGRRRELPPHLEEARVDVFNALKRLAPFLQALQSSEDAVFLQTAYFGKPDGLCSIQPSYRHLFSEILPSLTPKQKRELGYEDLLAPSQVSRRIRILVRRGT